jgi:HMG (high mobility group) box
VVPGERCTNVSRPLYIFLREPRSLSHSPYHLGLKGIVTPRASHEVPCPTLSRAARSFSHKRKVGPSSFVLPLTIPFISKSHLREMNSLSATPFCSPSLSPAPSSAPSTGAPPQFPFIPGTQIPAGISTSRDAPWLGAGSPSSPQSSPSPTNMVPCFTPPRVTQPNISFQIPHQFNFPVPPNSPAVDSQAQEFVFPYTQYPASICIEPQPVLNEKRPQRPRNAFMLFRSDFLKRGLIPKDQETRQHRLSIIAGKCWRRLTKEEKEKWFLKGENEKKAYAYRYGGNQPRTRTRTRREPKPSLRTEELEQLDRLADVAYQEIANHGSSPPALENVTSPQAPATLASPFRLNLVELPNPISGSQQHAETFLSPFSSPAEDAGFSDQSLLLTQMTALGDTYQNSGMFHGVSRYV